MDAERAARAEKGLRLYLVFTHPVEGAGDRGAVRDAHFAFRKELEARGVLFLGGPMVDEETGKTTGSGLAILRAASKTEAEAIIARDPFVSEGYRRYEVVAWRVNDGRIDLSLTLSEQSAALVNPRGA